MINAGILRTTDNDSSTRNLSKGAASEQKLPRLKAKALGDVQNTLHSRSTNFVNPNSNSAVKVPTKASVHLKPASFSSVKNASGRETNVTPRVSATKSTITTPSFELEQFETHDHKLCEEDLSHLDDYFSQYKFTDEQIRNLTRSVKVFVSPISVPICEPCEDIRIPDIKKCEEERFSFSDIFNDVIPEVPPLQ